MGNRLCCRNLAYGTTEGCAFVEVAGSYTVQQAISELHGREVDGRALNAARARPQRR